MENEYFFLILIMFGGLGASFLLSFATGAGETTESSTFNGCMGHRANFEVCKTFH